MYIFKKNVLCLYIYISYTLYEYYYIHVNILNIYCMCVYLYKHNKCKQYTHICYVNNNFYFEFILINCLTALFL